MARKPPRSTSTDVKVKDSVWRALLARAHNLDKLYAKVGVLQSKGGDRLHGGSAAERAARLINPRKQKRLPKPSTLTIVELAAIHEFGSPRAGVPERSFIRRTFNEPEGQDELEKICAKLAREVVTKGMDPKRAVGLLGSWGATAVKKRITQHVIPPPNAPATVRAKGSSRPLVDTGRLVGAITYEVVEGEGKDTK